MRLFCSSSWSGLQAWRNNTINVNRFWGPNGPQPTPPSSLFLTPTPPPSSLADFAALILSTPDPLTKAHLSHLAFSTWQHHNLPLGSSTPPPHPARPPKPQLLPPKQINNPGLPLNAFMLHNLAHVELNAIDLAWDTVARFSPISHILGDGFFDDFARVADDESRHFSWCSQRLKELGYEYGDMPAHNLLWRECEKSSDNVAARLAVIPLVQEARGLDAGPRLVRKLVGCGDVRTSRIVARIADEELAHVAVGVHWFVSVCRKLGCAPSYAFKDLLEEYNVELKGPFNFSARDEAGIPREWYDSSTNNIDNEEDENIRRDTREKLSKVYDRLASVISMESENSSLNRP